jgi:hypothetical protein
MDVISHIKITETQKVLPTNRWLRFLNVSSKKGIAGWHFWLLIVVLFILTGFVTVLGAEEANLIINNSHGNLFLSLRIRDVITEEVNASVTDEASSTIVFSIALYQVHDFWFDKKIAHYTVNNNIKYDSLKNEYSLTRSWESGPPLTFKAFNMARHMMAEVNNFKVMPLHRLEKGENYQIRVRAFCQDQNAFIFSPSGCAKTAWHRVNFTY